MRSFAKYLLGCGAVLAGAAVATLVVPALVAKSADEAVGAANTVPAPAVEQVQLAQVQQPDTAPAATFPGGATSVQESFQDWQVVCGAQGEVKRCAMIQQQHNATSRQRVLAIELQRNGESLTGALILPFGLLLEEGVTLQVDDEGSQTHHTFRTCLPNGCLVALTFDGVASKALGEGEALKVNAVADGGGELAFSVSLKGFSAARDRITVLTN